MISFGSGVPGGIFLPLLVLGAISGGLFAVGAGNIFGFENLYLANFVILGMAGLFSAIVRAPVTGIILITETLKISFLLRQWRWLLILQRICSTENLFMISYFPVCWQSAHPMVRQRKPADTRC